MRKVIVAILLIWAILATAVAFQQYQNVSKLKKEIVSLKWQVYSNRTTLEELKSEKETLEKRIQKLEDEKLRLIAEVENLRMENEELRNQLSELQVKISELEDKLRLYEQVPHGYYSTNFFPDHRNTYDELVKFLTTEFRLPHKYEKNVFDCSEISAYTEWALEDAGFDAYIILGEVDFGGDNKGIHAWNMVKVAGATYYIDMSSGKPHIFKSDKHHLKIIKVFKNIYEAIEYYYGVKEWDWWSVVGFPPEKVLS